MGSRTLLALVAMCAALPVFADNDPIVEAPAGKLRGESVGGLNVFKGIPYALPPIGESRWKPPVTMSMWSGVRDAKQFGAACVQPPSRAGNIYADPPPAISEDCLFLNIWAPRAARKAPVFVWIYGGALSSGASNLSMYEGSKLASRGVVFVSINYRLGILGYLAHPQLSAESPEKISGNYGLKDQIAALRWIQRNIAAFGGDPANVTIAGESAGALSVMHLMNSPPARGLFAKAIAQSAYMISLPELKQAKYGSPSAETIGEQLATAIGAPDLATLRSMDAAAMTSAAASTGYFPMNNVDGHTLLRQIVDSFEDGKQAKVPILAGFNQGEIRSLRVLIPPVPADAATYESAIRSRYADLADRFLKLYPGTNLEESILAITRDSLYGWTAEKLVKSQTALGERGFLYLFDHGYPAADTASLHAFHAAEIPYVFGNIDRTSAAWPKIPDAPLERALSDAMADYWTSFARTGEPRASHQPDWPAYGSTRAFMHFVDRPMPGTHVMPGMFELNDEVVCRRREQGDQPWNWNVGIVSPVLPPRGGCVR
ncbi:carboxylesterase/lipase family protein [Povalibacter sp.]|uniref:carboxylesterase/lipase family protein n=1 Tax=Povalibacter sp. TaxID=1962978 RepID=UPI002F420C09